MVENTVKITISFQSILEAVLALDGPEKQKIWEALELDLFPEEEDLAEDLADIEAARADYASGDYTTFDDYMMERAQKMP